MSGIQMPVGAVVPTAQTDTTTPPAGWLFCDGSSQLRASFPSLFSIIGTTYGSVDGTHFTLPDLRGRVPVGQGAGPGLTSRALAAKAGEEFHQNLSTESGIPAHTHVTDAQGNHQHDSNGGGSFVTEVGVSGFANITFGGGAKGNSQFTGIAGNHLHNVVANSAADAGVAHNTMQPFIVLSFLIKT